MIDIPRNRFTKRKSKKSKEASVRRSEGPLEASTTNAFLFAQFPRLVFVARVTTISRRRAKPIGKIRSIGAKEISKWERKKKKMMDRERILGKDSSERSRDSRERPYALRSSRPTEEIPRILSHRAAPISNISARNASTHVR